MDKEIVVEGAKYWAPSVKARRDATYASAVEGVDAAISAWTAGGRGRVSGQESMEEEGNLFWC